MMLDSPSINEHIKKIYSDGELTEEVSKSCGECADSVKADSCCKAEAAVEVVEAAK